MSFLLLLGNKVKSRRIVLITPAGEPFLMPDGSTQIALQMEDSILIGLTALQLPDGATNLLLADGTTYLSISKIFSSI